MSRSAEPRRRRKPHNDDVTGPYSYEPGRFSKGMTESPSIWEPIKLPTFRVIWLSVMLSNLGTMIQSVGAGWLMAGISGSDQMVALVHASNTMPMMVLSLISGALADNFDRRRLILVAQFFMLAVSLVLTVLTASGGITPWSLLTLTFLIGCGVAVHIPSWQASLRDIVPRNQISKAVTLNSMGFNLMRSLGPAAGGIIVALAGPAVAFACNAVSYVPIILSVMAWKHRPAPRALPRERLWPAMGIGLRYVALSPNLLSVMARGFLFSACAVSLLALLPLVARDVLEGTSVTFGLLLGSYGAGAICGGVFSTRLRDRFGNEIVARVTAIGFGMSAIGVGLSHETWLTLLLLLPAGACWLIMLSMLNMSIQLATPRWVLGRALSLYQTANFGGMASGSVLWGGMAALASPQVAILCSAGLLAFNVLFGIRFPLLQFEEADLDPLDTFIKPDLAVTLAPRGGPIAVTVEYEISQADIPAFLALMAERRRIRIRDGARRWALSRDLEEPQFWVESYKVPTWVEYVRHHARRTREDAHKTRRLLALHKGAAKPLVRRMVEHHQVPIREDLPLRAAIDSVWSQY